MKNAPTTPKRKYTRRATSSTQPRTTAHETTATGTTKIEPTPAIKLSAKLTRLVDGVRPGFRAFTTDFSTFVVSRAELAPAFGKAFTAYKEETELTLADFSRLLDPNVPLDRKGYRDHKSYQTADNLMRLYRQSQRPKKQAGPKAATALEGMARTLASVLPLIGADQLTKLWEQVGTELHWTDRQLAALQTRVNAATALVQVRPPRGAGGSVPQLRIAASRARTQDEGEEEATPRTGTHG